MPKEKKRRYYQKKGGHLKAKKVQAYGDELHKLQKKHKGLTAETVVDAASNTKSPLHDHFEWDDTKAARAHRLAEARYLVRTIEVEIVYIDSKRPKGVPATAKVRAYQHVSAEDGTSAYQTVDIVRSNKSYRQQIEKRLASDLERIGSELLLYQHLQGYGTSVNAIAKRVRKAKKGKVKKVA